MTALLACAALVVLVLAAVALGLHILHLLDTPSRPPRPPSWAPQPTNPSNPGQPSERGHVDRRHGWCEVCGLELHGPHLHEVTDAAVDDDGILTTGELMGGGTAMTAEFCPDHCPGTCRTPHPPSPSPFRSADPFREGERGAPHPAGPNPFRPSEQGHPHPG